jgi:hypothetical protein
MKQVWWKTSSRFLQSQARAREARRHPGDTSLNAAVGIPFLKPKVYHFQGALLQP